MAAPTWQSATTNDLGLGTGTTITLTAPASIADRDLLIIFIWWGNTPGTITPPPGFTQVETGTVGSNTMRCYSKVASGESGNYVVSWGTARGCIAEIHRISGVTTRGGLVVNTHASATGSATDPIASSVGSVIDSSLILACAVSASTTAPSNTPPGGWSEGTDHAIATSVGQFSIYTTINTAGPSGAATFDTTNAIAFNYIAMTIAISISNQLFNDYQFVKVGEGMSTTEKVR